MATTKTALFVRAPIERVFAFVSDFRHAPLWDPQAVSVEKTTPGEIALGTRYRMVGSLAWRKFELPYEIVEFAPSQRLVLTGTTRLLCYRDEISFRKTPEGTQIDYLADLVVRPAPGFVDGPLRLVFAGITRIATRKMAKVIEVHAR